MTLRTLLVANRGEIAVRIIRACRDLGITSVAVYAEPEAGSLHVRMADRSLDLGGSTAADSYLDRGRLLAAADASGADAVHPGYGFLSEDADFAQAVLDAGLTWVGPRPQTIRDLGDKVNARRIAAKVGAPLVAGSAGPVADAAEVIAFARAHGLPVAIKASAGGGGRGLRVARHIDEIPERFAAAAREATAAFGRGDCLVERYLDRARHVEAQVLADGHGHVMVVGDRDCTLQRRHQKLVEEAPAPFLSDDQRRTIHDAARAVCTEAGYVGAGTVEFLVGADGAISFLEVNPRIQVEHPVTEETSGIDLVGAQLRIAAGEDMGDLALVTRGHAMEFRITAEDPAQGFLPSPGALTRWTAPSGPGVRMDAGVEQGSTVGSQWDSMLAKLIVTGADRTEALARARRALAELVVEGVPTVLPFHLSVVDDPAFAARDAAGFRVHTRWVETEWIDQERAAGRLRPTVPPPTPPAPALIEVGGRTLAVSLPGAPDVGRLSRRTAEHSHGPARDSGVLVTPMPGTVVRVEVADGDRVRAGDLVAVIEAMKIEHAVVAPTAGVVTGLRAVVGTVLGPDAAICNIL